MNLSKIPQIPGLHFPLKFPEEFLKITGKSPTLCNPINNYNTIYIIAIAKTFKCNNRRSSEEKLRGVVCLFVNNSWYAISNINKVLRFCSPDLEYLMLTFTLHLSHLADALIQSDLQIDL
jgi:hypothetical protein